MIASASDNDRLTFKWSRRPCGIRAGGAATHGAMALKFFDQK
jgi:hypothetical protein